MTPSTEVTCVLPSGTSPSVGVIFIQAGGALAPLGNLSLVSAIPRVYLHLTHDLSGFFYLSVLLFQFLLIILLTAYFLETVSVGVWSVLRATPSVPKVHINKAPISIVWSVFLEGKLPTPFKTLSETCPSTMLTVLFPTLFCCEMSGTVIAKACWHAPAAARAATPQTPAPPAVYHVQPVMLKV